MKALLRAFLFASLVGCSLVRAQPLPQPVLLPIPNITQETPVWCWAAVAQQIVHSLKGPAGTPSQCAMVALANNAPPMACCPTMMNQQCWVTGSFPQIQALIAHFGGVWSNYSPPAHPMALYNTLASGRAVLIELRTGQTSSHVVVVRGMSFVPTMGGVEAVLHINDPMSMFTQPVPFSTIMPIWMGALVVG